MTLKEQTNLLIKKLNETKEKLEEFKKNYPNSYEDISKFENQILVLENKYKYLINKTIDWDTVQKNYTEYCKQFSPAYLSGCEWYQILGDDFKTGYINWKLNEFYYKNKEFIIGGFSTIFLSTI